MSILGFLSYIQVRASVSPRSSKHAAVTDKAHTMAPWDIADSIIQEANYGGPEAFQLDKALGSGNIRTRFLLLCEQSEQCETY